MLQFMSENVLIFCLMSDWMISIILFSTCLMYSSALFSLLLITFSLVFIVATELSNFDGFLFRDFSSLSQ